MGIGVAQLRRQLIDYTDSLFNQGILNDQFNQLLLLQSEGNPGFVYEMVTLFFQESDKLFNQIAASFGHGRNVDFKQLQAHIHQLKGSSASIGAQRVENSCAAFRICSDDNNFEGCLKCVEEVRNEYFILKNKMETLFKLEQQILAAGGSIPNTFRG